MYNNFDPIAFNESLAMDEVEYAGKTLDPFFYVSHSFMWLNGKTRTNAVSVIVFINKGLYEYLFYTTDSVLNFNIHVRKNVNHETGYLSLPEFMTEQIDRRVSILSLMD